jgi:hypothetical protein
VGGALKGHVHLHFQCQAVHEECLAKQHSVWHSTRLESSIMWLRCSVVQHTVTSKYGDKAGQKLCDFDSWQQNRQLSGATQISVQQVPDTVWE